MITFRKNIIDDDNYSYGNYSYGMYLSLLWIEASITYHIDRKIVPYNQVTISPVFNPFNVTTDCSDGLKISFKHRDYDVSYKDTKTPYFIFSNKKEEQKMYDIERIKPACRYWGHVTTYEKLKTQKDFKKNGNPNGDPREIFKKYRERLDLLVSISPFKENEYGVDEDLAKFLGRPHVSWYPPFNRWAGEREREIWDYRMKEILTELKRQIRVLENYLIKKKILVPQRLPYNPDNDLLKNVKNYFSSLFKKSENNKTAKPSAPAIENTNNSSNEIVEVSTNPEIQSYSNNSFSLFNQRKTQPLVEIKNNTINININNLTCNIL